MKPLSAGGSPAHEQPVLVCGLGAFGQAVLERLRPFAIPLRLLALQPPDWRSPALQRELGAAVTLGDMRLPHVLEQAGVREARAVLLLGSDSSANFEAALQVRLLNAAAGIVVRSSDQLGHLGCLLEQRLPGLTVVDPVQISAAALVQALRPGERVARFEVEGQAFAVFRGSLEDRRQQRPLRLDRGDGNLVVAPLTFHGNPALAAAGQRPGGWRQALSGLNQQRRRWLNQQRRLPWVLLAGFTALVAMGIALFARNGGWVQGAFVTLALLKGEYVDPTNVLIRHPPGSESGDVWMLSATLMYSLVGTLITSALVALILDQLISARFGLRHRRGLRQACEPVLLLGGGSLAGRVAAQLQRERHGVVRVETDPSVPDDGASVRFSTLDQALGALMGRGVRAVAVLSGSLLEDLQHILQLQALWPDARFAMLSRREGAGERFGALLGGAAVVSPIELGAEVVVATAFGERVEDVWRLADHTVLQVRYRVASGDTLEGFTLGRLEHGYGFTGIALRRNGHTPVQAPPPPEAVLCDGDEIVVLATLKVLRRVERGALEPPVARLHWRVASTLPGDRRFSLQQSLARYLGISPSAASVLLQRGSGDGVPIDPDISALLMREWRHQGVQTWVEMEQLEREQGSLE